MEVRWRKGLGGEGVIGCKVREAEDSEAREEDK